MLLIKEDVVVSENLLLKTSDPLLLTSDDIASASADLQDLQAAALTNANVGKFVTLV